MMDGCVHLLYKSSWKFRQLAAVQLMSGQSHLPAHSPPASQAGRRIKPAFYPSASLVFTGSSGAGSAHHATSYARFLQCNNQGAVSDTLIL
jgi:hypothetical protein